MLPLLIGLLIVLIAVNIPFIGRLVNVVLTLLGLGVIVQHVWRYAGKRRTIAEQAA